MIPTPAQVYEALKYRIEIGKNGSQRYYNADGQLHRIEGPAVEWEGGRRWYQNGQLHREIGPAIEWWNGSVEWWLNGVQLTESEFNQAIKIL